MSAYVRLQEHEFALEEDGYTATRHQREVGAGYFDQVVEAVSGGESSTLALGIDRGGPVRNREARGKGGGMTIAVELTRQVDGPNVLAVLEAGGVEGKLSKDGCEVIVERRRRRNGRAPARGLGRRHELPFVPVQVDGGNYALVPPAG